MKKIAKKELLKSLMDISGFTNFVESPDLILSLIIEECILQTRAEWGAVLSYDKNLNLNIFQMTKVMSDKEKARIASVLDKRVKNIIEKNGKNAILNEEFWKRREIKNNIKEAMSERIKEILACPVVKKDIFLGLAIVANKKTKEPFAKEDKESFSIICKEASIVIDNINLFKAKLQNERMAAIGQTIAGISHYVRNILQGISTGSYLLDAGLKSKDIKEVREAWDVVSRNTKRISELVLDMLYYSKEKKALKQKITPRALIEDVLELVQTRLKEKNIRLKLSIKSLPRYIVANEKGIHRSILNIITNAIDACDKKDSLIEFKTIFDKSTQTLKFIVSDNGKGLLKEERERIFQPFYTNKEGKGTGLGLAITKKVIEEHNGSLRVESELTKGTTFEISIPKGK